MANPVKVSVTMDDGTTEDFMSVADFMASPHALPAVETAHEDSQENAPVEASAETPETPAEV